MPRTIHDYRSVKLKKGLTQSVEDFLKTEKSKKLGINTIAEAIRYMVMQYLDKEVLTNAEN